MKAKTYMLDTDTFSYLVSGRYPAVRKHFAAHQKTIVLSSVTLAEALFGARKKGSDRLESLIGLFREIIPVRTWGDSDADAYAHIRVALEKSGTPIGGMDMLIAAAALAGGCVLVTNNTKHFDRVPGLALENWTEAHLPIRESRQGL